MIKLQVIGNLGKDCVTNSVGGKTVMNFSVAHTEKFRDQQGNPKERTIWVECAYWSEKTGVAPYLKKGTQVYVEGAPEIRTYTKNDGTTGVSLSLRVSNLLLLGSRQDSGSGENQNTQQGYAPSHAPAPAGISDTVDDLPF